jgi:hypothetical protein
LKKSRLLVVEETYKNGLTGSALARTGALVRTLADIGGEVHAAYHAKLSILS